MAKEIHFPSKEGRFGWACHKLVLSRFLIRPNNYVVNVRMGVVDFAGDLLHHSSELRTRLFNTEDQQI